VKQGSHAVKTLSDLYLQLGLPVDSIHASAGFSIHNLKNTGFQLPYQSPSFRPNYFSFLFVKDGAGKYAIDQYEFEVSPHSIYFTNPSNYRTAPISSSTTRETGPRQTRLYPISRPWE
jgi:hypothetical protein